jgi:outer membrane protein OmpA-like peptidoglycan-associated protein
MPGNGNNLTICTLVTPTRERPKTLVLTFSRGKRKFDFLTSIAMCISKRNLWFILLLVFVQAQSQNFAIVDTFDDNRYNWWTGEMNGGSQKIHDGKMFIDIPEKGWIMSIHPYVEFQKDFVAEMTIKQTGGFDDNGVGLMWGYNQKTGDENHFEITGNGNYYISNTKSERSADKKGIREWVPSSLIKPVGQINILKVEQASGKLNYYINGEKVATTYAFGWPGYSIGIMTNTKMTIEVDDFKFQQQGIRINLPPNLTKGFVKENLGPGVNTAAHDLMPRISADGRSIYFAREYFEGNLGGAEDGEDYYVSQLNGNIWSQAKNLGEPINSTGIDNIGSISTDNNTVLFADGSKFWQRSRSENGWAAPRELGVTFANEANHFESCLSSDGKALVFTLKNPNNLYYNKDQEERDLYVSLQDQNNNWSTPLNLGPKINTRLDEVSPFLAADGRTLYFSSDGRPGYGGADIFMTKRIGDSWTNWTEPVNLGPEINSSSFDAYYVLPASGEYAYMVTDQGGYGKTDVIRIKLAKELKPDPVVLVKGKTLDAKTKDPISADILVVNLSTGKEIGEAISDPATGDYKIVLPYGVNYGFHAAAAGHLSVSENLEIIAVSTYTELEKNLYLLPIAVGQAIQLNNVFFQQGTATLKIESYPELDRLVQIMKENPALEIEIGGYTDNVGKPTSLVSLSQNRVTTVKKYMTDHGIEGKRIVGKGYGPANPVVKNDTEEHRRMNRRVEFKIIKS